MLRALILAAGALAVGLGMVRWAEKAEERTEEVVETPALDERIRVEVLNGGGRSGMARAGTDHLRGFGFDVVALGNAPSFDRDSSVVLDRVGRPDWANRVARAMGIALVETERDSTRYVDVSVILGAEWEPPGPGITSEEEEEGPSWWDPRRIWR